MLNYLLEANLDKDQLRKLLSQQNPSLVQPSRSTRYQRHQGKHNNVKFTISVAI